jgi:hypothetical protein
MLLLHPHPHRNNRWSSLYRPSSFLLSALLRTRNQIYIDNMKELVVSMLWDIGLGMVEEKTRPH